MPVAFITARRTRLAFATCPLARKAPLVFAVQRSASSLPFVYPPPWQAASQGQARCSAHVCAPRAPGAEPQSLQHHSISGAPSALRPSGWPNRSLKLTRYGVRCKPGLLPLRHHRSPGLQRTPPRAA
jgi:hypothetical protein